MNKFNMNLGIRGEFKVSVKRNDQAHYESDWFDNLILNNGLNYLGNGANISDPPSPLAYCRVGTGDTPPIATQINLVDSVGSAVYVATDFINLGAAEDYATLMTLQYNFTQGSILTTIREAGVGWSFDGGTLFSRVVLPEPITLTSIDQLIVFYRLRLEPSIVDTTGTVVISGTSYGFTSRIAEVASFGTGLEYINPKNFSTISSCLAYDNTSALGPVTGNLVPGGSGTQADVFTAQEYIADTYNRTTTVTYMPSTANLVGGIQGFRIATGTISAPVIKWQMLLDDPIPKTDQELFTITFRIGWNRV